MNPSFGSSPINAGGAVSQGMSQGMPAPLQQSQQSPNYQAPLQAPPQPPMPSRQFTMPHPLAASPQISPQGMIAQAQAPQSPGGAQVTKTEAELILESLGQRLKHLSESEKMKLESSLPPKIV